MSTRTSSCRRQFVTRWDSSWAAGLSHVQEGPESSLQRATEDEGGMISTFGPSGQRIAIDLSTVLGVVEGEAINRVYVAGEPEPFPVYAQDVTFDELVKAWRKQ